MPPSPITPLASPSILILSSGLYSISSNVSLLLGTAIVYTQSFCLQSTREIPKNMVDRYHLKEVTISIKWIICEYVLIDHVAGAWFHKRLVRLKYCDYIVS